MVHVFDRAFLLNNAKLKNEKPITYHTDRISLWLFKIIKPCRSKNINNNHNNRVVLR